MSRHTTNLAIMLVDISGSTQLHGSLVDVTARREVSKCLKTITVVIKRHASLVIRSIGDEVMCTVVNADEAAACEMPEVLERMNSRFKPRPMRLPSPFASGCGAVRPLLAQSDVFGDAVNVAARMPSIDKPGRIVTTQSIVEKLPLILHPGTRFCTQGGNAAQRLGAEQPRDPFAGEPKEGVIFVLEN